MAASDDDEAAPPQSLLPPSSPPPPSLPTSLLLTELDFDAITCVLSQLAAVDLARVACCAHRLHDNVQRAADLRAARIGVCLAPYHGLAQLRFLQAKEAAKEAAERRKERVRLERQAAENLVEQFVYNAQYALWMPASADPHTWAAQNLAPLAPLAPEPS